MAITSIKTGSSFTNLIKYNDFLGPNSAYIPTSYESIASQTVGAGGSTSITFSSIPSTYAALQIRYMAKWSAAAVDFADIQIAVNTSTSYAYHTLQGSGSAASAAGSASQSTAYINTYIPSGTANTFGVGLIDIQDYASTTKNKTIRVFGGFDRNGSGYISLSSILSNNTAAINSITLTAFSPDKFDQNSVFSLYGIKGA